jgi:hypothetical protein
MTVQLPCVVLRRAKLEGTQRLIQQQIPPMPPTGILGTRSPPDTGDTMGYMDTGIPLLVPELR